MKPLKDEDIARALNELGMDMKPPPKDQARNLVKDAMEQIKRDRKSVV